MTDEHYEFTIEEKGERLDKLVHAQLLRLSRVQVQALIKEGLVSVNGVPVTKAGEKFKGGERVSVRVVLPQETLPEAEDIPLKVYYEDDALAVIEKPAGLVVHPGAGNESGTLVNALLARYPELLAMAEEEDDADERDRVGIVHRLDKDTSGLMVIARTHEAHRLLAAQFQERSVEKIYLALVERAPKSLQGMIDAPIGRDPRQRKRMAVQANGRPAQTQFEVIDQDFRDGQALLRVTLFTGRTHQIRVHMAFIGCPVVNDPLYGFRRPRLALRRHFLHATHLAFDHPLTGARMSFDSPLPQELVDALALAR